MVPYDRERLLDSHKTTHPPTAGATVPSGSGPARAAGNFEPGKARRAGGAAAREGGRPSGSSGPAGRLALSVITAGGAVAGGGGGGGGQGGGGVLETEVG